MYLAIQSDFLQPRILACFDLPQALVIVEYLGKFECHRDVIDHLTKDFIRYFGLSCLCKVDRVPIIDSFKAIHYLLTAMRVELFTRDWAK